MICTIRIFELNCKIKSSRKEVFLDCESKSTKTFVLSANINDILKKIVSLLMKTMVFE